MDQKRFIGEENQIRKGILLSAVADKNPWASVQPVSSVCACMLYIICFCPDNYMTLD